MIRSTELPFLPGYSFNYNVGQTRFHKSQHLELIGKEIPYLSEKTLPGIGGVPLPSTEVNRFPSIYARGEVTELPSWVVYDKETLCFDCYYIENIYEGGLYKNYVVHKCKLCYFLEDGTIQVFEKPTDNSGLPQGCIIRRQKIKLPTAGNSATFYDAIDLNIGKKIDLFGKIFKITDCDVFTRRFLNRLGIPVPDPMPIPEDPYLEIRTMQEENLKKRKQGIKMKVMKNLLEMDNRILKFFGYWDDTLNNHGVLHKLKIFYYLADDTIEIKDVTDPSNICTLVKRSKFPKGIESGLPPPGASEPVTILNVIGPSVEKSRKVVDPLGIGLEQKDCYTDKDLTIGSILSSYGRRFVITDMDQFTKEYYKHKYGLEDINPLEMPKTKEELILEKGMSIRPKTPPYNGFGDYDDSMRSVKFLIPSAKVSPWKIDPEKDPFGYDSKILRFGALLIENGTEAKGRKFIIRYYLMDDTISVYEIPFANSGRDGGTIIKRRKIPVYGQNLFKSSPLETVSLKEFFIGNIVNLDNFKFKLVETDEYTMRHMEQHPSKFPKSNIRYLINKVRKSVKSDYKKWAAPFIIDENNTVPYHQFRSSLKTILGEGISEHEILALGRHFGEKSPIDMVNKDSIRTLVHDELRRLLYEDFQRLRENFQHLDPERTGYVSLADAYSVLRGAKVPIPYDLVLVIIEMFTQKQKDEEISKINYNELIDFLNYRKHQLPSGYRTDFGAGFPTHKILTKPVEISTFHVNVKRLIGELELEEELKQQSL